MFENELFIYSWMFFFGACLGSFANVVILRLPQEQSVIFPSSHCPKCKKKIKWYDNIPLASWLMLKGCCRHCGGRISPRYFIVEFLMGVLFVLSIHYAGLSWTLAEYLLFCFGLVVCAFIDLDHMILPDEFTLSGIVIGLVGAYLNPQRELLDAFLGVILGGGFLWLMAWLYYVITKNEGMGGGDIKLLAWIGAILGWKAVPFVIVSSAIIGSVVGLAMSWRQGKGLKAVIPFGPFLALGALLYLFGGQTLALWYLDLFFPEFA